MGDGSVLIGGHGKVEWFDLIINWGGVACRRRGWVSMHAGRKVRGGVVPHCVMDTWELVLIVRS